MFGMFFFHHIWGVIFDGHVHARQADNCKTSCMFNMLIYYRLPATTGIIGEMPSEKKMTVMTRNTTTFASLRAYHVGRYFASQLP